jgi:hypothetical protein
MRRCFEFFINTNGNLLQINGKVTRVNRLRVAGPGFVLQQCRIFLTRTTFRPAVGRNVTAG